MSTTFHVVCKLTILFAKLYDLTEIFTTVMNQSSIQILENCLAVSLGNIWREK